MAICRELRARNRVVFPWTWLASVVVLLVTPDAFCQSSVGAVGSVGSVSWRPFVLSWNPVIGRNGAIGGVSIDGSGVVSRTTLDDTAMLSDAWLKASKPVAAVLNRPSRLRKVSLTRLEAALTRYLDERAALPDEMMFLAGLQRVEFVFVYPKTKEIVIVDSHQRV